MNGHQTVSYTHLQGSAIPAILYYIGIGISVHLLSYRFSILGLPKNSLPTMREIILKRGLFFVPIIMIVILLVYGYSPMIVGFYSTISTIVVSYFIKGGNRITIRRAIKAFEEAGKNVKMCIRDRIKS